MTRTGKEQVETVEALASEAFKEFTLTHHEDGSWWCRNPKSFCHNFRVWMPPGMTVVWGDIGEYVIRHSDPNSMRWFMTATSRDYFLGKVRAVDGAKKDFMVGDAWAHLRQWKADIVAELETELEVEEGEEAEVAHRPPVNPDDAADPSYNDPRLVYWRTVADEFTNLLDDEEREPKTAWALAHYRNGDSEWPACEEWSSSMLWLWEAVKTFRRLHRVAWLVEGIHDLRRRISECVDGPQSRIEVLEAQLKDLEVAHAQARAEAAGGTPTVLAVPGAGGGPPGDAGGPQPGGGDQDGPAEVPR